MSELKFACPKCKQSLEGDDSIQGQVVECPSCNTQITVPAAMQVRPEAQVSGGMMFCPKCGQQNLENNLKCTRCGHCLHGAIPPQIVVNGDDSAAMRMLLPIGRSGWAIASGYLGLFSVLLVPAPFALLTGILAVVDIRKHSEKHGMGRAVFGIVMGALGTIGLMAVIIMSLI